MREVVTNLKTVNMSFDEEMARTPEEREFYRNNPVTELPITDDGLTIALLDSTPKEREEVRQQMKEQGLI